MTRKTFSNRLFRAIASNGAIGIAVCCALFASPTSASADHISTEPDNLTIVRSTYYPPEDVIESIKTFAKANKWQFVGTSKVKNKDGDTTIVVVCLPELARAVLPPRLQSSVLLPCAHIAVYEKMDYTEVSVLNPRYTHWLYVYVGFQKAGNVAAPLIMEMLDAIPE